MEPKEWIEQQKEERAAVVRVDVVSVRLTALESVRLTAVANADFNGSVSDCIRYAIAQLEVGSDE
jgi:hypothetical protein